MPWSIILDMYYPNIYQCVVSERCKSKIQNESAAPLAAMGHWFPTLFIMEAKDSSLMCCRHAAIQDIDLRA
jgi:hypothetical protein